MFRQVLLTSTVRNIFRRERRICTQILVISMCNRPQAREIIKILTKLFPNFTSIPFDYLLISWVTNYTHNRGVLTCLLHQDKFLPRFDDFMFFVTDSKIHQTLNFYLKSTKANRLAKVIRVLSGKFTESCITLLHRARLRRLHKYIQNTHSKLVLTKVNFGSKFVFKN